VICAGESPPHFAFAVAFAFAFAVAFEVANDQDIRESGR
jgi:hypothetical protein